MRMNLIGIRKSSFPIGGVLAATWRICVRRFWAVLSIIMMVYVPYELIAFALEPQDDSWRDVARGIQIDGLLSTLIGILATLALYLLVEGEVTGQSVTVWQSLKHALCRWRSGVATELLWNLVVIAGLAALVVPGVIFLGWFVFASCAVSLRDCSLRSALSYSKSLVRGRWWSVMGVLLVVGATAFATMIVVSLLLDLVREHFLVDIADSLVSDCVLSFLTVATGVYFLALDPRGSETRAPSDAAAGPEGLIAPDQPPSNADLITLTPTPPEGQ